MEWTTTVNKFVLLFQTIEKECAEQYLGLKCAKQHPWQESSVFIFYLGNNLKNRRKCVHHYRQKARKKGLKKVFS